MRQIKFRVWDKKVKRMYQNIETKSNFVDFLNDDSWGVMQFTGLLDKNGKEIYEGDILGKTKNQPIGVIRTFEEHQSSTDSSIIAGFYIDGWYSDVLYIEEEVFEVIGNVFENPELLSE